MGPRGVLHFLLTCDFMLTVSGIDNCPWSRETVQEVYFCPTNQSAVEVRKKIKNCEKLANQQNCTDPEKFSYHCLMNDKRNALVEVCAPVYFISGYCAEYNTVGERIHPHYHLKCSDVKPPCGSRYISTDAYLYEGCYAAVKREETGTFSSTVDMTTTATQANQEIKPEVIAGITSGLLVTIIVVLCLILICLRKKRKNQKSTNEEETPLMSITENTDELRKEDYEKALTRAKVLRDTVQNKEEQGDDNTQENERKTESYLKAYTKVDKHYVETGLTKACKQKLDKHGMAVLIGQQGSGKTLTAVHIMSSTDYADWGKQKVISWEDLLVSNFTKSTIVYIDNLFDGFLYNQEVEKWLDSLCYFYFECLKPKDNIRLIITAKTDAIEKACSFIKSDTLFLIKTCTVREDLFPLSIEEKMEIFDHQIKLAKELKDIDLHFTREKLKLELQDKKCPLGFPLCAHMYAFEKQSSFRDSFIFDNPRTYVRTHIREEINNDKTNGVKTLFLFLLFYHSQEAAHFTETLDLKYGRECLKFLKSKCSEKLVDKMQLSPDNLSEKAEELEDSVLIKHYTMFEFKHQIYLEEVSEYFFRTHFDAVVDHFPLSILRTYEMHDNSTAEVTKLVDRIKKELEGGAMSEALSCKVFEEPKFEQELCKALENESQLIENLLSIPDKTSGFKFPIIFWTNKYKLSKLSKVFMDFAENHRGDALLQFYLARFGECCAADENYITKASFPTQIKELQDLVLNFETSAGKTIFHLILLSDKTDDDACRIITQIMEKVRKSTLNPDKSLLNCVLQQKEYSRLQCLMKILHTVPKSVTNKKCYVPYLVDESKEAVSSKNTLLEVELLCRIGIFVAHGLNILTRKNVSAFLGERKIIKPAGTNELQNCIAGQIEKKLELINGNDFSVDEHISITGKMTPGFLTVVKKTVTKLQNVKLEN